MNKSQGDVTTPFWTGPWKRLVVTFAVPDDTCVIALGRDPDNHNDVVFRADLRPALQDAFLQAVRDGVPGTLTDIAVNDNAPPLNGTVVITGPGSGDGTGDGPKFWIDLTPP